MFFELRRNMGLTYRINKTIIIMVNVKATSISRIFFGIDSSETNPKNTPKSIIHVKIMINDIKKQLSDSQTMFLDKTNIADKLQLELKQIKSELLAKNEELRELKTSQRELEIKEDVYGLIGENLKEKIRAYNEISKNLDIADNDIKTKKIYNEE